eukprot:109697_1
MWSKGRAVAVLFGFIIHTSIALVTHIYTEQDYGQSVGNIYMDFMMNILYFTVIDSTLCVFKINRSSVRIWHWKISTVIMVSSLILYFSNNKSIHFILFSLLMAWAYKKLQTESKCFKVGLEKYVKKANSDYYNITFIRNFKYVLITLAEIVAIYYHYTYFFSPLLFVILDAILNRIINKP